MVDPDEQVRARAQALWEAALARQAGEGATTPSPDPFSSGARKISSGSSPSEGEAR